MEKDIFAGYIQNMKQFPQREISQQPILASQVKNQAEEDTISLLKEISLKLNKLEHLEQAPMTTPKAVGFLDTAVTNRQSAGFVDMAIINGQVVLPDNGIFSLDVYIQDGKIHSLGTRGSLQAHKTIDAAGLYVCPGIIDPHVHLGLFAPLETELATETKSAVMGGITTACCYFGGAKSYFEALPEIAETIRRKSYVDIVPHLVIGTEEQKQEIPDYVHHLGVRSFKVYLNGIPGLIPDVDDGFVLDVFDKMKESGRKCLLCVHAENRDMIRRANKMAREEKGKNATVADWTATHPDMAEEEAVIRLSYLAEKSQTSVYFVHISSKAGISRLREIKLKNKYVHVETTSPYLSITKQNITGAAFKMEPPFRDMEDMEALWQAVEEGTVECIGTDNVTMTKSEKNQEGSMWDAMPGYPALETHLPSVLSEGVAKRGVPMETLIGALTKCPAEVFGIYPQKGTLLPGSDADVVLIDMEKIKEVKAANLHSRSDYSIFENRKLQGWPVMTIKGGKVLMENGSFINDVPEGSMIKR